MIRCKFSWVPSLAVVSVVGAFIYLNLRHLPRFVILGWPKIWLRIDGHGTDANIHYFFFDIGLLIFCTIGVAFAVGRWSYDSRATFSLKHALAAISTIATYFSMFPGPWNFLFAVHETASAIVFWAILLAWLELFRFVGSCADCLMHD